MEQLMVKCKGCYTPFPVPDEAEQGTFAAPGATSKLYECPHCRIRRPYDEADHFFAE